MRVVKTCARCKFAYSMSSFYVRYERAKVCRSCVKEGVTQSTWRVPAWLVEEHNTRLRAEAKRRGANRLSIRESASAWRDRNPDKVLHASAMRRAAEIAACPSWADMSAIAAVYRLCSRLRALGFDCEVDHIVPLRGAEVRGLHVAENLNVLPTSVNREKSNRFSLEAVLPVLRTEREWIQHWGSTCAS